MNPGDRYGYLVVVGKAEPRARTAQWRLICGCGKVTVQDKHALTSGRVVSCGCVGALGRAASRNQLRIRAEQTRLSAETAHPKPAYHRDEALCVLAAFPA